MSSWLYLYYKSTLLWIKYICELRSCQIDAAPQNRSFLQCKYFEPTVISYLPPLTASLTLKINRFLVGNGGTAPHLQLYYLLKLIHHFKGSRREETLSTSFPRAFAHDWNANDSQTDARLLFCTNNSLTSPNETMWQRTAVLHKNLFVIDKILTLCHKINYLVYFVIIFAKTCVKIPWNGTFYA